MGEIGTLTRYGQLELEVHEDAFLAGRAAATSVAGVIEAEIAERGAAAVILATGNSQLSFYTALRSADVHWDRVRVFHMDEYLGIAPDHSAAFRRYMLENLVEATRPMAFFGIEGDAPDIDAEIQRYRALLERYQPVACVMGIGENGHLAFNDPPADFQEPEPVRVVELSEASRHQQVGEGHFPRIEDVPTHAISLSIPALLTPAHVFVVVPEARKARAVAASLRGPITPECPASILRTVPGARLYLDRESAAGLAGEPEREVDR